MESLPAPVPDQEPKPETLQYQSRGAEAAFKGWRAGAVAFGVIAILLGVCNGCLALVAPLAILMPRPKGTPGPRLGDLIVGVLMYSGAAGGLIWLGIGAIRTRRWVRPLVLTVGTLTILAGIYGLLMMAMMLPIMRNAMLRAQPAGTPGSLPQFFAVMMATMFAMIAVLLVILPGAFVWFYGNQNVKAMLDYFDPTPTWADRCPLPVLAVVVALVLHAGFTLISVPAAVAPFFGALISGLPAAGMRLLEVVLALLFARLVFRLRLAGWWGTLAFVLLTALSYGMTGLRPNQPELYRRAGYSEQQVEAMQPFQSISTSQRLALWLPVLLVMIGYLLYVRGYFTGRRSGEDSLSAVVES